MYTIFNAGTNEYKLRLNTRGMVDIEKHLGSNPLTIFMSLTGDELPKMGDLMVILWAGMQPYNHGISIDKTYDIYDQFVEDGKTYMDLIPIILELFKVSGLFKEVDNEKN